MTAPVSILDLIDRKKRGDAMDARDLGLLCRGAAAGTIPDYQLAAWLMATWFTGMRQHETFGLTRAMVDTGVTLDWAGLGRPVVDKHSTGGVGDKTSLVLVPLVAAAGVAFPKMSGRGLGHTGGTLDKLESIPGYEVDLSPGRLRRQVERIGCAIVGQSPGLVPADGALYALRDVTGTVDSLPLIAASIMSKKLAGGAETIVLDVKHGTGAFMATPADARVLARTMVEIGREAGRKVRAVLSSMERPLGRAVGNALEVREAVDTLRGNGPADLWELSRELGVELLLLSGFRTDREDAAAELTRLRDSGEALRRLGTMVAEQGGDPRFIAEPELLPRAPIVEAVRAGEDGRIARIDPRALADVVLRLGGARRVKGAAIDAAAGVRLHVSVGDEVRRNDALAEVHAASAAAAAEVAPLLRAAFRLDPDSAPANPPAPLEFVDPELPV